MDVLNPTSGLAWCVLAALLTAGCVSSPAPSAGPDATIDVQVDSSTGAITGLVQDDSLVPLAGVTLGILEKNIETTSGKNGEYSFNALAPGTYRVVATKLGYQTTAKAAEVRAGQVSPLNLIMTPVATLKDPHVETIIAQGYIACGFATPVVVVSNTNVCAWDTNHKPQIDFDVVKAKDPKAIVLELTWQRATSATATDLAYGLWKDPGCQPPPCESANRISEVDGESPLQLVVLEKQFDKKLNPEGPTRFSALTFVGTSQAVVVVYQQRVTHYISIFYDAEPAADFTAIPPR